MKSALVIDDDEDFRQALRDVLERAGYDVELASAGRAGLTATTIARPDIVLLDLSMPGMDGWQVLEGIRERGAMPPVIVISAYARESDKVRALRMGADDYVTKPFSNPELLARMGAVMRRGAVDVETREPRELSFGPIVIDLERRAATRDGSALPLTKSEFDLLVALVSAPNRAFTRRQLADRVLGPDWFGDEHAIDMHVSRLRRKLGDATGAPRFIETVRGVGFRMAPAPSGSGEPSAGP